MNDLRGDNDYKDIFRFGDHDMMIPFELMDDNEALQQIDLTYFLTKCRDILKDVYDQKFKVHNNF